MPKITADTCKLPLDEDRRQAIIDGLVSNFIDTCNDSESLHEVARSGHKGFNDYTDEELIEEAGVVFGDAPWFDASPLGEYYHDFEPTSGAWCVFHSETSKAYASYSSESEAKEEAAKRNRKI